MALIESFVQNLAANAQLEFSYYKYFPQSFLDRRRIINIRAKELSTERVKDLLEDLRADEELAFHSLIAVGPRRRLHFPLIDFCGRLDAEAMKVVRDAIGERLFERLALYNSGRSFHGYILRPMPTREWVRFMGKLLLTNLPNKPLIADSRWIGHRLIAGYSSLRWSKNTAHYTSLPFRVPIEEIVSPALENDR